MHRRYFAIIATALLGCSGKFVGDDGGVDANPINDGGIATDGAADGSTSPLAGTWVGYIESFKFGDGSDAVTMTLADNGTISGTIFFGAGPAIAPPTNPDIGYPPSGDDRREAFYFTARIPVWAAPRFTVNVDEVEMFKQWCELQTTIYAYGNDQPDGGCGATLGYHCLPNVAYGGTPDGGCEWTSCDHPLPTNIDCAKLTLCTNGPCICTATSCTVTEGPGTIAFDTQLAGNMLNGSIAGLDGDVHNVHLTRQ